MSFLRCRTDSGDRSSMVSGCHTACRMSIALAVLFSTVVHFDCVEASNPFSHVCGFQRAQTFGGTWYAYHATHPCTCSVLGRELAHGMMRITSVAWGRFTCDSHLDRVETLPLRLNDILTIKAALVVDPSARESVLCCTLLHSCS